MLRGISGDLNVSREGVIRQDKFSQKEKQVLLLVFLLAFVHLKSRKKNNLPTITRVVLKCYHSVSVMFQLNIPVCPFVSYLISLDLTCVHLLHHMVITGH